MLFKNARIQRAINLIKNYKREEKQPSKPDSFSYDSEWLKTDLPLIQEAAINAAADDKGFICINQDGLIEDTDYQVDVEKLNTKTLSSLFGEDCNLIKKNKKVIIQWDD